MFSSFIFDRAILRIEGSESSNATFLRVGMLWILERDIFLNSAFVEFKVNLFSNSIFFIFLIAYNPLSKLGSLYAISRYP